MSSAETKSDKFEDNFKILKQGAEAKIYVGTYLGVPAIVKERFQKHYRHPDLDSSITKDRIKNEARSIVRCKVIGVITPCLYLVDMERRRIYMEYFTRSITVKEYLITTVKNVKDDDQVDIENVIKNIAWMIGLTIRRIHTNNIIHGDLTTSNMLIIPYKQEEHVNWFDFENLDIALIDFGLSHIDSSTEDKGVDLYVLERAVISTHNDLPNLFDQIIQGYKTTGKPDIVETLSKFEEVRARGRKRTMVG